MSLLVHNQVDLRVKDKLYQKGTKIYNVYLCVPELSLLAGLMANRILYR